VKLKSVGIIGLMVFAAACMSVIPKESLKQADPEITFQGLIKDPEKYAGKVILTGGQIISTARREGQSWVEVLQQPLDERQRPQNKDVSYGRFLIRFEGFLDPEIYMAGRKITVLGEVSGKKVQPLNGMEYIYPVFVPRSHYLWKIEAYGGSFIHFGIGAGEVIR